MVRVPPTLNVWEESVTTQEGLQEEVKSVTVSVLEPLVSVAEVGNLTLKDWPALPVAVKTSAVVGVSGHTLLDEVAVPSGRTVMDCGAVEERQMLPKFNAASLGCASDICGAMYTRTVTGTSVQFV